MTPIYENYEYEFSLRKMWRELDELLDTKEAS